MFKKCSFLRCPTPQFTALRWPCFPYVVLTLNKCQLYGTILTHGSSLLKLTNTSLSTGVRESFTVIPVAQGDAVATAFTQLLIRV